MKTAFLHYATGSTAAFLLVFGAHLALAQNAAGPVHFPMVTNAPSAGTPPAAPGWLQPSATPNASPGTAPSAGSFSPPPTGDIHDIHGPISIPYEWFWLLLVVVLALVAAALFALWRFAPRRAAARVRSPYEVALERLDAARPLLSTETVREYAFAVSEIIRVYIEQRFGEVAARRTTEEFISDLLGQAWSPLALHRGRLEDFLSHCDLIKFARWSATTRELELMHESARAFIVETHPQSDFPDPGTREDKPPSTPQARFASVK